MAVNSFLKLGDPLDGGKYGRTPVWRVDPFLEPKKVEIAHLEKYKGPNYRVFSLEVGNNKKVGVHFYCDNTGPWGAFDKTVEILELAKRKGWKLSAVFVVGCCGASVNKAKKKQFPRGTILVAKQVKEYLYKGKVKRDANAGANADQLLVPCKIESSPYIHNMEEKWLRELCHAQKVNRNDCYNEIAVEIVPFLSGPLVIKDCLFGNWFRERDADAAGVEMEAVGVIKAVEAFHKFSAAGTPELKEPSIFLVKGISDYTGGKGERATCMFFGKTTEKVDDDTLQVYATLQSIALVIRFLAQTIEHW